MKPSNLLRSILAGALGIGLIIGLFFLTGVTFDQLAKLFEQLNWLAFAGIIVCTFIYVILGGMKWQLIAGTPAPRPFFYTHYTAHAMLLGQFLPMPVAIAINRAAVMKLKQNSTVKKGLLNAIYDMGFDFLIAAILIPASLLQLTYRFEFAPWLGLAAATIVLTTIVLMLAPKFLPKRLLNQPWLAQERKRGLLAPKLIALMMLLSTARFAVTVLRIILGAVAIGIVFPYAVMAYATPILTMSALIALTPGNLGIAEWSMTYLLQVWGIAAATSALYGVSFRILVFFAQLIVSGIVWILFESKKQAQKK